MCVCFFVILTQYNKAFKRLSVDYASFLPNFIVQEMFLGIFFNKSSSSFTCLQVS